MLYVWGVYLAAFFSFLYSPLRILAFFWRSTMTCKHEERERERERQRERQRETNAQGQAQDGGSSQAHLVEGDHSRRQRVSAPKTEPFLLPRVRGARRPAGRVRPSLRPREDRGRSAGHPAKGFRSDALVSSRLSSSSSNSTTTTSCSSLLPFFVCLAPCCLLFARPPQRRQDLPDAPVR